MWKRLKKWHFDVAILLGLACFAWAYWYVKPRPAWTSYYTSADPNLRYNFTVLGYSVDDQSIYTAYEMWPVPRLQRWSVATGEMLEEFDLQLTEEEQFISQQPRKHIGYSGYEITLCDDRRHFLLRHDLAKQMDHEYVRVFGVDGKAVGHRLELPRYHRAQWLTDDSPMNRHWLATTQLNKPIQNETPLVVIDLDTGKPVREPLMLNYYKLHGAPTVIDGKLFSFILTAKEPEPLQMEVYDPLKGESLGRIRLPQGINHWLFPVDSTHYAVCSMNGGNFSEFQSIIHFYRYDPQSKQFKEEISHPLNGFVSEHMHRFLVQPPYLVSVKSHESPNSSKVVQTIMDWLARLGIGRNSEGRTIKVARLSDGTLVRQCSGIPGETARISHQYESVTHADNSKGVPGLSLYRIPHYVWEQTLSWMQWLAWLLVVPWPLRYFVRG